MRLIYFIWSLVERFGTNFVSLGGNIVLSYLLMPEDFGLVAMLGVFTSLIFVLVDCGLSDGLLTMGRPSDRDFNTVFFFNVAVGIALCAIYCGISPFVAAYFSRPEIQPVMCALGVGAFFSSMTISQMTKLRCGLQFKKLAAFNILSITIALAIAILMALNGMKYWALVELQVGFSTVYWLLLAIFSQWTLKWEFDTERFKKLWKFGVNLLASTILTQTAQNIFAFVIGKYITASHAGYMGQAQKLQQTPTNSLEAAISTTSYVLIAQKESRAEKCQAVQEMFGAVTFINSTFCFMMLALSFPLIDFIFPAKWLPSIPYFRLLLCWALVYPVCNFMMVIFKVFDRTAVIRNVLLAEKALIVASAFLLYPLGIEAMIVAAIGWSALTLVLFILFASRTTGIAALSFIRTYFAHLAMIAVVGAVAFGVVALVQPFGSLAAVIVGLVAFMAVLAVATRLFRPSYYAYAVERLRIIFRHHD